MTPTGELRAESHLAVGALIRRDGPRIIELWAQRSLREQPRAKAVHRETLRNDLPAFLDQLGRSLMEEGNENASPQCASAHGHGKQRWHAGWSLPELITDYQLLRIVIIESLEEALGRHLETREVLAVNVSIDDAIAAAVQAHVDENSERNQQADDELRRQTEALKDAHRRKDMFLAMLGHELRNPLAPLRNAVHLLALKPDDRSTVDWVRGVLDRQVSSMTRLVDELLDASRIGSGKIVLNRGQVDLVKITRDTIEDRRQTVAENKLDLHLELPHGPLWIDGDPVRLTQVVGNLLQNAVKFTDAGGRITVRLVEEPEDRYATLIVSDTGIGMESEVLRHIFDPFMQSERSAGRSRGGLGLGLPLVKGLVELHGGSITATSMGLGLGSQFRIRLPLLSI
ncbi:MAG: HAMP domain-containing histidine kinase [Gemmataceae bacterium]|nr:HAMP domain-containing histidine kinase [Gemmataceae bacterium]